MNSLSATAINRTSPYAVMPETEYTFSFVTDKNCAYELGFVEDQMISDEGVYQFFIKNVDDINPVKDIKIRQTVVAVLEEFFNTNNDVVLYICDTRDGKQNLRSRLFTMWFSSYSSQGAYYFKSYSINVADEEFYAAIIMRKNNPQFDVFIQSFEDFVSDFKDKFNE